MARKKVKLQWITNRVTRRATYKKRLKGLLKKTRELSTLCNVKVCVVVYGEDEVHPEVWPSTAEAMDIIASFKGMPQLAQCKNMMNQEDFFRQRVSKLQEQVQKSEHELHKLRTMLLFNDTISGRCPNPPGLTIEEITALEWEVESQLEQVKSRLENFQKKDLPAQPQMLLSSPSLSMLPFPHTTGNMGMNVPAQQAPRQEREFMDKVYSSGELGASGNSSFADGNSDSANNRG